jgi:hypothetical protein
MRPWILQRFDGVSGRDPQWRAECPACGGRRSLSISGESEDRYLVRCFAGCEAKDVVAHVGLRFTDLLFETTAAESSFDSKPAGCDLEAGARGGCTYGGISVDRRSVDSRSEVEGLLERHDQGRLGAVVAPIELPGLPDGATEPMERARVFLAQLFALREWAGMEPEAIVSSHWLADKLDLPQPTAWRALRDLTAAGVLTEAGRRHGRNHKRGPRLYMPGDGASVERRESDAAASDVLPAPAGRVEAARPGGIVDMRQEADDDGAVDGAVADDGREAPERGGRLTATRYAAEGAHGPEGTPGSGRRGGRET